MKLIDSDVEIIPQEPGIVGMMRLIERAGRTAYKSEPRITESSYQKFIEMIKKRGHWSVLEQGSVYLRWHLGNSKMMTTFLGSDVSRFTKSCVDSIDHAYYNTTTNYRFIVQNGLEDEMYKYWCDPDNGDWYHRVSTLWTTSRGITHELVRHRVFSYVMESTRYVNYEKRGFQYIIPQWIYKLRDELANTIDPITSEPRTYLQNLSGEDLWNELCILDRSVASRDKCLKFLEDEYNYETTTDEGYKCKPEDARDILPHQIKADIWITGFYDDWMHKPEEDTTEQAGFFNLRCAPAAHPDIRHLSQYLRQQFDFLGYVK